MNGSKLFIPLSIVIAALIISGAIFFARGDDTGNNQAATGGENSGEQAEVTVNPVSDDDHILGNPDAEIFVVEYSDFECPFCGRFHPTMERIIEDYADTGEVAWVYRHFPLDQIHPRARPAAEASECVAELGGNTAFWDYSKILFEGTPNSLTEENLLAAATEIGVDADAYTSCVESNRYRTAVNDDYEDGLALAQADPQFGTPYSVIITKDGQQVTIPGAQPYNVVKQVIDTLLAGETQ